MRPVLARTRDAVAELRFRTTPLRELVAYLAGAADIEKLRVAISGVDLALGSAAAAIDAARPATTSAPDTANGNLR